MKKCILILLLVFLIPLSVCIAEDNPFPVLFNPNAKILIDGDAGDWPITLPFILDSMSQIVEGKVENKDEHMAVVYCFFDNEDVFGGPFKLFWQNY